MTMTKEEALKHVVALLAMNSRKAELGAERTPFTFPSRDVDGTTEDDIDDIDDIDDMEDIDDIDDTTASDIAYSTERANREAAQALGIEQPYIEKLEYYRTLLK